MNTEYNNFDKYKVEYILKGETEQKSAELAFDRCEAEFKALNEVDENE